VSLGGVDSLLQHPAALTHRPVAAPARPPQGLIRLSIGLEDPGDLIADLDAALSPQPRPVPQPAARPAARSRPPRRNGAGCLDRSTNPLMYNPAEESTTCGRGTPPLMIDAAGQR